MRTRKRWIALLLLASLLCSLLLIPVAAASGNTTVYITATGEKYHKKGCQYLSRSCYDIELQDAVDRGYTRCSRCNPPTLSTSSSKSSKSDPLKYSEDDLTAKVKSALAEQQKTHEEEMQKAERAANRKLSKCIWWSIVSVVVLSVVIWNAIDKASKKQIAKCKQDAERERDEWISTHIEQKEWFAGRSCRELANVPSGVVMGMNYLPVEINGESCTVFLNRDHTRYHRKECYHRTSVAAINVYDLPSGCLPCRACNPISYAGKPEWLLKYREYIKIKEKYKIDDPDIPFPDAALLKEPKDP